jgi:hypothetical protein
MTPRHNSVLKVNGQLLNAGKNEIKDRFAYIAHIPTIEYSSSSFRLVQTSCKSMLSTHKQRLSIWA